MRFLGEAIPKEWGWLHPYGDDPPSVIWFKFSYRKDVKGYGGKKGIEERISEFANRYGGDGKNWKCNYCLGKSGDLAIVCAKKVAKG